MLRLGRSTVVLLCFRLQANIYKNRESDKSLPFHCFQTDQQLKRQWIVKIQKDMGVKQGKTPYVLTHELLLGNSLCKHLTTS